MPRDVARGLLAAAWLLLATLAPGNSAIAAKLTDSTIRAAVNEWVQQGRSSHGNINTWDVTEVRNFKSLFDTKKNFNSDIGKWKTTSMTSVSTQSTTPDVYPLAPPRRAGECCGTTRQRQASHPHAHKCA